MIDNNIFIAITWTHYICLQTTDHGNHAFEIGNPFAVTDDYTLFCP